MMQLAEVIVGVNTYFPYVLSSTIEPMNNWRTQVMHASDYSV